MGLGVESHGTLHCPCKLEAALPAASTSTPRAPRPAPAVCVRVVCSGGVWGGQIAVAKNQNQERVFKVL